MTNTAFFRFFAQLNDFLPRDRREVCFAYAFRELASVKDMIEALGVPHPEVERIVVNGEPVDFSYTVRDGDQVAVYPAGEGLRERDEAHVALRPPNPERFVLDAHLGRLAGLLRMLGFDTLYRNDYHDAELAQLAAAERILLTRDRGLLKRRAVVHGYFVRETDPERQAVEIMRRFDLWRLISPFRRCIRCNGLLETVAKEHIANRLAPKTLLYYDEFRRCSSCDTLYWKGSHFEKMQQRIERLLRDEGGV